MATVIALGMGKGGVGKTTTTVMLCTCLADLGYKVLGVDFDPQGNFSEMSTQITVKEFEDRTIFDAMKEKNPKKYIIKSAYSFDVLPADDYLAFLSKFLYEDYKDGEVYAFLSDSLDLVKDQYDFILIDLPPNLGDHTVNALYSADYAIPIFHPEPFGYDGLERYMGTISFVRDLNPKLSILGIVTSMMDGVASIDNHFYKSAQEDYGDLLFRTIIRKRVRIKEFSYLGIQNKTTKDKMIIQPYVHLAKEVVSRVLKGKAVQTDDAKEKVGS